MLVSRTGPGLVVKDLNGLPIARLSLHAPDPATLVGADPTVYAGPPRPPIIELVDRFGRLVDHNDAADAMLILHEPGRHHADAIDIAREAGWRVSETKVLYRHAGAIPPARPPSASLRTRPWRLDEDGAALVAASTGSSRSTALQLWATLIARGTATEPETPVGWVVAETRTGEPVGFALPGWLDPGHRAGTNLFLGVLPAWRGAGIGPWLQGHVVRYLRERGATDVYGSTEIENVAMRTVFDRLGYRQLRVQRFLRR